MATLKFNVRVVGHIRRQKEGEVDKFTTVLKTAKYREAILFEGDVIYPVGAKLKLIQTPGLPSRLQER